MHFKNYVEKAEVSKCFLYIQNEKLGVTLHFSEIIKLQFEYVIGLHAVQFGNNWMRKIPRTAKLDKHVVLLPINYRAGVSIKAGYRRSTAAYRASYRRLLRPRGKGPYSLFSGHSHLHVFYHQQPLIEKVIETPDRASKNSLFKAKLNIRAKAIQFILNWTVCKN